MEKTSEELLQERDLAFYAAGVNAYYMTKLEYDKSLLALSTGGIGLLFTLLTTKGVNSSAALVLYIAAISCFLVCLICVLVIFNENGKLISEILSKPDVNDTKLVLLDKISKITFGLAVFLVTLLSISLAIESPIRKGSNMTVEKQTSVNDVQTVKSSGEHLERSFAGIQTLKPVNTQAQQTQQTQQAQNTTQEKSK